MISSSRELCILCMCILIHVFPSLLLVYLKVVRWIRVMCIVYTLPLVAFACRCVCVFYLFFISYGFCLLVPCEMILDMRKVLPVERAILFPKEINIIRHWTHLPTIYKQKFSATLTSIFVKYFIIKREKLNSAKRILKLNFYFFLNVCYTRACHLNVYYIFV